MKIFPVLLLAVAMTACKNKRATEDKPVEIDSLTAVKNIIKNDSIIISKKRLDKWIEGALQKNNIDWKKLRLEEYAKEEKHPAEPFAAGENFYKDYKEVLRWSPDSTYVLDIGSYGSVLVKDKKGETHVEAGEPDTEISLLKLKDNQKRSLFFVGPSSVIIDATWANPSNALILGSFDEQGNNHPDTLFWLIDVKDNFYRMYKWKR